VEFAVIASSCRVDRRVQSRHRSVTFLDVGYLYSTVPAVEIFGGQGDEQPLTTVETGLQCVQWPGTQSLTGAEQGQEPQWLVIAVYIL
jgi:hypothetical protein